MVFTPFLPVDRPLQGLELCLSLETESISNVSAEAANGENSYFELIYQLAIYYTLQSITYYIGRYRFTHREDSVITETE